MSKSGLYTIKSKKDNKLYLGLAVNIEKRISNHIIKLRVNSHRNIHLQRAWNKYGEDNFVFEVFIECSKEYLKSEEHYWANMLNVHSDRYGYNIRPTHPEGKSSLSESTKKLIGDKNRGKIGRKASLETRLKMSKSFKGRKMSKEFSENLRIKNLGKKLSKETKTKMSLSKINKRMTCHHIPVTLVDPISLLNKEFECVTDLAKYLNCATTQISRVISGKQKYLKGFKIIKHETKMQKLR